MRIVVAAKADNQTMAESVYHEGACVDASDSEGPRPPKP